MLPRREELLVAFGAACIAFALLALLLVGFWRG